MSFTDTNPTDLATYLYLGYFGRAPESAGLTYWVDQLTWNPITNPQPASFGDAASGFATTGEAQADYPLFAEVLAGTTPTTTDIYNFLNSVYANLFDRAPDQGGEQYWTTVIQQFLTNPVPRQVALNIGGIIADIISGAWGTGSVTDAATLEDKATIAEYYTTQFQAHGQTGTDTSSSVAILQGVTSDPQSVTTAEASINLLWATSSAPATTALSNALLAQHMASSFAAHSPGPGGGLASDPIPTSAIQQFLAQSHHA